MSFDGLFTHAIVHELDQKLTTGRVAKVSQPYPAELIITIRAHRHNYPLLFWLIQHTHESKLLRFHIKIQQFQLILQ